MAAAISIQETTVLPSSGWLAVQLYVSDKPAADALSADLVLTLRIKIDRRESERLANIQRKALEDMLDVLKPLLRDLHAKVQTD
jgi:hypothetical protein